MTISDHADPFVLTPAEPQTAAAPRFAPKPPSRVVAASGVAIAAALGLFFGLVVKPNIVSADTHAQAAVVQIPTAYEGVQDAAPVQAYSYAYDDARVPDLPMTPVADRHVRHAAYADPAQAILAQRPSGTEDDSPVAMDSESAPVEPASADQKGVEQ